MNLQMDAARLSAELRHLATISEAEPPAVTRIVYSPQERRARSWIKELCLEAGLIVRDDAIGNTFACWPGSRPELAAVGTGSHIDAIPNAGMYDGTVGVLGGLEAIRTLKRSGFHPARPIELLIFSAEEPTRFGIGCSGSRVLAGVLPTHAAAQLKDADGKTLDTWRTEAGFTGSLESVPLPAGAYSFFVELHIEQGPLLEREGLDIGVVTHIAAPASLRLTFEGEGGHAGAVLMPDRRDALAGAAEVVLAVESAAKASGAPDTVATVGVCNVFPGAVNSIPSRVQLEVDIRDIQLERRDRVITEIIMAARVAAQHRGLRLATETINQDRPATCDPQAIEAILASAQEAGATHRTMVSRAYHDSLFLSRIAPTAMIFIPCRNGVSHRPDEYSSPEQIALGTEVLARTLATLSLRI